MIDSKDVVQGRVGLSVLSSKTLLAAGVRHSTVQCPLMEELLNSHFYSRREACFFSRFSVS